MNDAEIVRRFYDESVEYEWGRLDRHPFEFAITTRYLDRYIRPGDHVLDIGGGPGRYSLYLAERGCAVTLCDLSENNVAFALERAAEAGLALTGIAGDAREADTLAAGTFDHVLLMGPLYHLLDEGGRRRAVEAALAKLRPGGVLFASFISLYAGVCYAMVNQPELFVEDSEAEYLKCYRDNRLYSGDAFTRACFMPPGDILALMAGYPLEWLHLFGQEGVTAVGHLRLMETEEAVRAAWLELAYEGCEREEFLAFSEHLMYVGRKIAQ